MSVLVGKIAGNKSKCMSIYTASVCLVHYMMNVKVGIESVRPKKLAKNSGTIGGRTAPLAHADHLLRRSCRYTLHGGDHQTIPD